MPRRILIVDDHAIVRRMLKVLVETQPEWQVCGEAENGQEAIARVREHKPDVVIMDMAMPVKDGISASREISLAMPDVPIVMYTLHYSPELELEAKKSGVRKVVPKAESGEALLQAIAEVLKGDSTGGRLPTVATQEISPVNNAERSKAAGCDGQNGPLQKK